MKYILISKYAKIILTEDEREKLLIILNNSKSPMIGIKGQFIDKMGINIFELPFFLKQEADTLKPKGLKRCAKCGDIGNRLDKCACSDCPELRKNNIFADESINLLK